MSQVARPKGAGFYERIEREIDFQHEYEKIENIVLNESVSRRRTLNDKISEIFRKWKDRGNFLSFEELRDYLGFTYAEDPDNSWGLIPTGHINGIKDFLIYCEMLFNMFVELRIQKCLDNLDLVNEIIKTINYDLNRLGYSALTIEDGKIIIVQENIITIAVADIVDIDLADALIKYNHYLLKGNIEEKKKILKMIADALEPKRAYLKGINKTIEHDFFYLVNTMNIRHNNCDPLDENHYKPKFAQLDKGTQEAWYDEIYQEGLMAFLCLEQVERNQRILDFRREDTGEQV